jgi:hypothetical protein
MGTRQIVTGMASCIVIRRYNSLLVKRLATSVSLLVKVQIKYHMDIIQSLLFIFFANE